MEMITGGGPATIIILGLLAIFSITSWVIILWKFRQFRQIRRQGALRAVAGTVPAVEDAYRCAEIAGHRPRVFRQDQFLQRAEARRFVRARHRPGLTGATQAMRLVLEKSVAERDDLASGLTCGDDRDRLALSACSAQS